ncbi:hypothetical protein HOY80DRAFT_918402 [Tuber brumale]|nr:hypothetical protein HOY80DRAFT_918402 [Tuber brumale]
MNNSHNQTLFNNNSNSFNVINSGNTTYNYKTISDEGPRILSWISPLESLKRHYDVASARVKGVGEWVLQTSQFLAWRDKGNDQSVGAILLCLGAQGVGKTFVCSLVIDTLWDGASRPNVSVGYVYCDYRGQKEQTLNVMVRSLLRQFVTRLPEIPEAITQAFREAKTHLGERAPELAKIIGLFPAVLERFQQAFICVDGLDELAAHHRSLFLRSLHQILDESPNTRLFLTARAHTGIESDLERNIPLNTSIITIRPRPRDIEEYLVTKLNADLHPREMDDTLRLEIMTTIPKKASEMWVWLNIVVKL